MKRNQFKRKNGTEGNGITNKQNKTGKTRNKLKNKVKILKNKLIKRIERTENQNHSTRIKRSQNKNGDETGNVKIIPRIVTYCYE